MCYDIETLHHRSLKFLKRSGASADDINAAVDAFNKRFNPLYPEPRVEHNYHLSGFQHPLIPVIHVYKGKPHIEPMYWGLIPFWCKDTDLANKLWNQTINARSESMFEKPSFRGPAKYRRGVITVESFFEHHHLNKQSYPFNIRSKDGEPLLMAVLWDEWTDNSTGEIRQTFSIVTVEGNEILTAIHNNPRLQGPRMPLILEEEQVVSWLGLATEDLEPKDILALCQPFSSSKLKAYPVRKLRGKKAVGNVPEAIERFDYPELALIPELQEILQ
jgi:putative SOS response-associated peptidase YedK